MQRRAVAALCNTNSAIIRQELRVESVKKGHRKYGRLWSLRSAACADAGVADRAPRSFLFSRSFGELLDRGDQCRARHLLCSRDDFGIL